MMMMMVVADRERFEVQMLATNNTSCKQFKVDCPSKIFCDVLFVPSSSCMYQLLVIIFALMQLHNQRKPPQSHTFFIHDPNEHREQLHKTCKPPKPCSLYFLNYLRRIVTNLPADDEVWSDFGDVTGGKKRSYFRQWGEQSNALTKGGDEWLMTSYLPQFHKELWWHRCVTNLVKSTFLINVVDIEPLIS